MMVSVQSTGALERRMEVQVPKDRIEQEVTQRLRDVGRTARLKGFRPGKVPINVLRQQFGRQIRQEVISDLMRSSFSEAVTQQKLIPAAGPRIEPISTGQGEDLKYAAIFEVLPEIDLKGIDGIEVERPIASVTEEDIDTMIESLRKQAPNWNVVERPSKSGDRVNVDFTGRIDGEPFEGGKGEGVGIVVGAGQMLPEFETGLVGVSAGEEKKIDVRFPDDYHNKAMAAKSASFDISVKNVEESSLPEVDDKFCAAYGIAEGGVTALRQAVGDNMRRELQENIRAREKSQVLERVLAANPLELPASLVEAQVRELQAETARRMGSRDATQVRDPFVEPARRRVAIGLLIAEIIKREKIQVDRERLNERLQDLVASYENPQEMIRAYQQQPEAMRQVEMLVLEEQVVDWLLSRARITDQPTTFKALMKFGAG
jgi:trigger factor